MSERLLSYDDFTGISTYHSVDPSTGLSILRSVADVSPTLEHNKARQTDGSNGWVDREHLFKHVATIPAAVIHKWLIEEGIDIYKRDHLPAVLRKLNSNEYLYLRTSLGNLGKGSRD